MSKRLPPKYQSPEFKKLQDKWYKKLEKSGFEDIEPHEHSLKSWHSLFFLKPKNNPLRWQAKAEYYMMAEKFLNEHVFEKNLHKVIWEYHSVGISYRDITKILKKVRVKTNRTTVMQIVHKYETIMKNLYMYTGANSEGSENDQ